MKQVNNASGIAVRQVAGKNVPVDRSMISTEAPTVDQDTISIDQDKRKIRPSRFGNRKKIKQDDSEDDSKNNQLKDQI